MAVGGTAMVVVATKSNRECHSSVFAPLRSLVPVGMLINPPMRYGSQYDAGVCVASRASMVLIERFRTLHKFQRHGPIL